MYARIATSAIARGILVVWASLSPRAWADGTDWPCFRGGAAGRAHAEVEYAPDFHRWRVFENPFGWAPPVVSGGVCLAAGGDHILRAFDPLGGEQLWEFSTGANVSVAPACLNGVAYVASEDHVLYALNAATGKELFRFLLQSDAIVAPIVAGGTLYAGSELGSLFALEASSGSLAWQRDLGAGIAALASDGGRVYAGVEDHRILALSPEDGQTVWQAETDDNPAPALAVADGRLFVADLLGHLQCMDARNGKRLWRAPVSLLYGSVPAVAGGAVFVTTDRRKGAALAADGGGLLWESSLGGEPATSSPVVGASDVYYGKYRCTNSNVNAVDRETGKLRTSLCCTPKRPNLKPPPPGVPRHHLALGDGFIMIAGATRLLTLVADEQEGGGGRSTATAISIRLPSGNLPGHPTAVLDVYPLLPDGSAPVRLNPPPPWKVCHTGDHTLVALDATKSWDAYHHPLFRYGWREPMGNAPFVERPFGLGGHSIFLRVWDEEMVPSLFPAQHHLRIDPLPQTIRFFESRQQKMDDILGALRAR